MGTLRTHNLEYFHRTASLYNKPYISYDLFTRCVTLGNRLAKNKMKQKLSANALETGLLLTQEQSDLVSG